MTRPRGRTRAVVFISVLAASCGPSAGPSSPGTEGPPGDDPEPVFYEPDQFVMGADLSYVNQILDHGGNYADSLGYRSPYAIFADHGANMVRLRLWHDPEWVRTDVYQDPDVPLYSGLEDVIRAAREATAEGMQFLLDLHYSDTWADPGRQNVPDAWKDITDLQVLTDSVYAYTAAVLQSLAAEGMVPALVQVGNEINCGMLSTDTEPAFPNLSVCDGKWAAQGQVLNAGIRAVRAVAPDARIILHIAQPENVRRFFDGIIGTGGVEDFDIIGFSYYSLWSDQPLGSIDSHVETWRQRYGKDVMVVETAYPWTLGDIDAYPNIFDDEALVAGYPATPAGQRDFMAALIQQVIDGGGIGVFYWEPAWITSQMKDLWGTGSAWDNNTLFDARGRTHPGMEFYTLPYDIE
jgi:arabinogalactan endo-1,4-beta-galactosidase